jgi:hypothetical protein
VTKVARWGRAQLLSVVVLSALLGVGCFVLHIAQVRHLPYGLSFSVGLFALAVMLYTGHRQFRVVHGLLLLATAIALVFVGLTRAIDGVETVWLFPVMSAALGYCCWVTLVSKSAGRFLAECQRGLPSAAGVAMSGGTACAVTTKRFGALPIHRNG